MDWQQIASSKRAALLDAIPPAWRLRDSDIPPPSRLKDVTTFITRFLTPLEQQITNAVPEMIIENIELLNWTAVEVTQAFCHRAALAHQLTCCLAEIRFQEAQQRAEELDTILRTTGRTIGPLHGLPVSLKDRFHVKGLESCCGYVSWVGKRKTEADEGVLVRRLQQAGAVIFVNTNVPTSMLIGETTNNIIGSTINPFNRNLSAGGASGGEGALLALKGSPIGWGSDISGSVRIPCSFNNLYGIRPTFGRISAKGLATSLPGLPTATSVIGPMCTNLESLINAMKWYINSNAWQDDHEVVDLPWNEEKFSNTRNRISQPGLSNGSLIFAVMTDDEEVFIHPPVQRAMTIVINALRQCGYEVIDWKPPPHSPAADIFFQILGSTAGQAIREAVKASGETPIIQLGDLFNGTDLNSSSTSEFWHLCQIREEFRSRYHEYWKATRDRTTSKRVADAVIMPVAPHAAPPEGSFKYYAYSAIPSILDFTTGSLPVTFADQFLDHEMLHYQPRNQKDRQNWSLYSRALFDGSPVGVQIMGQKYQEEKVLAMMEAVQKALQEYGGTHSRN